MLSIFIELSEQRDIGESDGIGVIDAILGGKEAEMRPEPVFSARIMRILEQREKETRLGKVLSFEDVVDRLRDASDPDQAFGQVDEDDSEAA